MRSLLVLTTVLALTTAAHADGTDRRDGSRIGATAGFTTMGNVGIEYAQRVTDDVEVGLGVGYGLFVRTDTQLAVMPRLRHRWGAITASAGAGVSEGNYYNLSPFADPGPTVRALYGNVEAGVQASAKWGGFARFSVGASRILSHGDVEMTSSRVPETLHDTLPNVGLTIGYVL